MTTPDDAGVEAVARGRRLSLPKLATALAIVLAACLVILLAWGILKGSPRSGLVASIAEGQAPPAPSFDLEAVWPEDRAWPRQLQPALADGRLALEELRGRPAVLNMWASWCIPCREEAPILNASARAHSGEVTFVGIDVRDLRGDALDFLREFRLPYVSLRDREDQTFRAFGLTGVPETYYLDRTGRIVAHSPGAITRPTLEAGIRQAIQGEPTR
jgi:cytochrome c biogenesis protein CcmG/thiol:disulfide interchange protein DsbE